MRLLSWRYKLMRIHVEVAVRAMRMSQVAWGGFLRDAGR